MKNVIFWDVGSCGPCRKEVSRNVMPPIIRVKGINLLGKTLAVTSTLMFEAISSSEKTVFSRATRRHMP
jgi:hypothetical protein